MTSVLVLVGSLRADSLNRKLAEKLVQIAPEGVSVTIAEGLADVPFYNEDIDGDAAPSAASALREQVAAADAVLAVTPEYNATIPAVLNNAIDWVSRPYGNGAIVGKPFGVIGTTPTPYGGKWAHEHTRLSAKIAGAHVVEDIDLSHSALGSDPLSDPVVEAALIEVLESLANAEAPVAA
jgi:NAD(P)H-dependent FMN reductase